MKFLLFKLYKTVKFKWKLAAHFDTSNQNNCNRFQQQNESVNNRIQKHLNNYTEAIVHLRFKEYC